MNSLLAILAEAGGVPVAVLLKALKGAAVAAPDAAEEINLLIGKIQAPLDAGNIADVLRLLPAEIRDIFAGHFKAREHPSDAG